MSDELEFFVIFAQDILLFLLCPFSVLEKVHFGLLTMKREQDWFNSYEKQQHIIHFHIPSYHILDCSILDLPGIFAD